MNTERLFKVTAADMSGNVIEWYVEPGPGKLAYFTEQQARSLLVWSLRTGKLSARGMRVPSEALLETECGGRSSR